MSFKKLQQAVKAASQAYYTTGNSGVSDAEFDEMLEEVRRQDPNSPLLGTGHGYDIDQDTTPGEKVTHKYGEAGSLDKVHFYNELTKGMRNTTVASLKIDGLSAVLYYKDGKLERVLTRGNGSVGIDITNKALAINPAIAEIDDITFTGAVRGEIAMTDEMFAQFQKVKPEAENSRNSAAGLINSGEVTPELKYLQFVFYRMIACETGVIPDYLLMSAWLSTQFGEENCAPYTLITYTSEDEFQYAMQELRDEWYSQYPADGIVLTDNTLSVQDNGYIEFKSVAFKFPAERKVSTVTGVEWNLTKSRYLFPRIQIEPTRLSGATVTYCTGVHAQWMEDNGIGPGAVIELCRSGEVIPKVEKVIRSVQVTLPTVCPKCEARLVREGVHLKCPNEACGNATLQDLLIWTENISPVEGFKDSLKVKYFQRFFGNKPLTVDDLMLSEIHLNGLDFTSSQDEMFFRMYHGLFNVAIPLSNAIAALNIPRFGEVTSKKLAAFPKLVESLMRQEDVQYQLASAIGNANAEAAYAYLSKWARLQFVWSRIVLDGITSSQTAKGKVAITGKLSVGRADFEKELKAAGYSTGDLTKDCIFLITDNPNSGSSKNAKADKLGIQKITEAEFRAKYLNN